MFILKFNLAVFKSYQPTSLDSALRVDGYRDRDAVYKTGWHGCEK